jgi:hypothetical protein
MMRAMLHELIDPPADNEELNGTAFPCGNDLRQKHLEPARIVAVRRLREAGQPRRPPRRRNDHVWLVWRHE